MLNYRRRLRARHLWDGPARRTGGRWTQTVRTCAGTRHFCYPFWRRP